MKVSFLLISLFILFNQNAFSYSPKVIISGKSIGCNTPSHKEVLFFDSPSSAKVAHSNGGALADFIHNNGFGIYVDTKQLNSMPFFASIFTVYHECAHVVLPIKVGKGPDRHEKKADCHALKAMKKDGYLSEWKPFVQGLNDVMKNGGSHSLSTKRIGDMKQCFEKAK